MTEIISIARVAAAVGDVIFVHGLGGDPYATWGLGQNDCWREWIVANRPDLNIWSIAYNVDPSDWRGNAMPLSDRALNILAMLDNHSIGSRPIVFVAHSMGGLLVKEMLRHALTVTPRYRRVADSTKAVIFFATPHAGASLADIASYFSFIVRPTVAVSELAAQQPRLRDLNLWFRNNYSALGLKSCIFFETHETHGVRVVNETSADPGIPLISPIPIDANHITITKPKRYTDVAVGQTLKTIDEAIPSDSYHYDPDRNFHTENAVPARRTGDGKDDEDRFRPPRGRWPLLVAAGVVVAAGIGLLIWKTSWTQPPGLVISDMYIGQYIGLPNIHLRTSVNNSSSSRAYLSVNSAILSSPNNLREVRLFVELILNCNSSVPTTPVVSIEPKTASVCAYSLISPYNFQAVQVRVNEAQKGLMMSGPRENLIEGALLKELTELATRNLIWEAGEWELKLEYSLSGSDQSVRVKFNVTETDVKQFKRLIDYYGSGYGVYQNTRYLTPDGTQPMRHVPSRTTVTEK